MRLEGKIEDYSDLDLALLVLLDVFGSGDERKKALGGHYYRIQSLVNQIRHTGLVPVPLTDFPEEKIRLVFEHQRPTEQEFQDYVEAFINALKEEK